MSEEKTNPMDILLGKTPSSQAGPVDITSPEGLAKIQMAIDLAPQFKDQIIAQALDSMGIRGIETKAQQKARRIASRENRPYYKAAFANQFLPIINAMMIDGKPRVFYAEHYKPKSLSTIYNCLADSRMFICDQLDPDGRYKEFFRSVEFNREGMPKYFAIVPIQVEEFKIIDQILLDYEPFESIRTMVNDYIANEDNMNTKIELPNDNPKKGPLCKQFTLTTKEVEHLQSVLEQVGSVCQGVIQESKIRIIKMEPDKGAA